MSGTKLFYKQLFPIEDIFDLDPLIEGIKKARFNGIFFPFSYSQFNGPKLSRRQYFDFAPFHTLAKQAGLEVGLYIPCFESAKLWSKEDFSPPVNHAGSSAVSDEHYYPLCPNNPMSFNHFKNILKRLARLPDCDYYLFDYLHFPFDWERESLDVQYPLPKYCYCPFCVTEFSSMMGEVVSTASQIMEYLEEWLEWRTQVVNNLVLMARETLGPKGRIIISVPPLVLIDLPFTTGQLPAALSDMGCYIAPKLYHPTHQGNFMWIEDLLDQYLLELKPNKIFPQMQVNSEREYVSAVEMGNKYKPVGILMSIYKTD
jgi:hypothetical protein